MDTSAWKTHCFGRQLVDLPPDARIIQRYELLSEEVQRLQGDIAVGKAQIEAREQALKAEKHETAGSMFIREVPLANGSVALISYNRAFNTNSLRVYTYLVAGGTEPRMYLYNTFVSLRLEKTAIAFFEFLSKNIRALAPNEIPNGQGFCIDGAFIAGNENRSESSMVDITLPNHPGAQIEIFATTQGEVEPSLLDRLKAEGLSALLARFNGLKVLRKGKHPVGELAAEEYLTVGEENGHRMYAFAWEVPGKASSVAEPNISVQLGVLDNSDEDEGPPPPPAFKSDEEALQLWDAIINSIRPRPGTADAPPAPPPQPLSNYSRQKAQSEQHALEDFLYTPPTRR